MKNSRFKKLIGKKSTGIIITILTFVIVFGAIFTVSNLSLAADSLPGIVDIRNDMANTDNAYRILEIVPNIDAAEFGFLVGGEEPLDAATLYDTTKLDWITWQEYLTKNTENMSTDDRMNYLNTLVANNADYISIGAPSADKPMWYQTYTEELVTPETPGVQVLYGGNTPVYGWLVSDDSRGIGWNAKFSELSFDDTYDNLVASTTPYYIVDASKADAEVALDEDTLKKYPDHYYTYKKDANGKVFLPVETIGQLKEKCEADNAWYSMLSDYYIVKFKILTVDDYTSTAGPVVYEASDFVYLDTDAPYTIPPRTDKGHNLTKPSNNIYYTGGLYSNEMFKQHTLDLDAAELANYKVNVLTVTAGELNAMNREQLIEYLGTIDFIYINAGNDSYKYDFSNSNLDIDDEAVELIFEKICNEKTPCIVDAYLKEQGDIDDTISDTRMFALACMLMQADYRAILSDGEFDVSKLQTGTSYVNDWSSNVQTTNLCNYVNGNVMVINSMLANHKLTDNYYATAYATDVVEAAYSSVLDEIELENLYRAADQTAGYAPLSTDIYKATAVRYIMNYVSARSIETKTSIEVLEIQPGNVKEPGNSETINERGDIELTPSRIRRWLGVDKSVAVNITTMNTMEFIGTIEDLNSEYDLIYIGADIAGLTRTKVGDDYITDYKEEPGYTSMDGLIYANVGGLTRVNSQFAGHLETDWKKKYSKVYSTVLARYNGNDITADKYNELVDYVKGTYPIVVSDKLCASDTAPTQSTVDNCTYLYSFLEEHLKDANVFRASEVENGNNTNFKFYANRGKLNIGTKVVASEESSVTGGTAFVQPGAYRTSNDTTERHVTYISKENGNYYLTYKFTITNNGAVYENTRYTAALYLDSNSDGKFSVEYEKIPDITLTHVASGKVVENGKLLAGEQYTLTRQVPDSYSGLLTWKVEVSQTHPDALKVNATEADKKKTTYIRDSITGYTRLANTPPVTINVLQVRRDKGEPLILADAIGSGKGNGNNNTLNALVWGGYCQKDGITYKGISDEYNFQFTTITNAEFNKKYANNTLNLMSYDMVVLGFYDSYDVRYGAESDINEQAVKGPGGLREYIDSGRSVLFAHDTTSVTIVPNYKAVTVDGKSGNLYSASGAGANVWGYYLNKYIRDMVGLDTYGITLSSKDGINYFSEVKSGKDLNDTTNGRKLMAKLKNELDSDGYYKIGLKPLAYVPNSNKNHTVPQTQGFLYAWMDIHWKNDDITYRRSNSSYNTYTADKVNEGAVTTYPYYLENEIDIARTHHQYFTLDLNTDDDKDGETDLVVWYTMGGNYNNTSRKDVMNSYYIYNKGNITYTGFGDFDTADSRRAATVVDECKLFVNTLVAAYNASVKEPQITVYESEENLTPTSTFYEYGDVDNDVAFRADTQRMYFSVNDLNVIRGTKTATAEYYVALKPNMIAANATSYTADGKTYSVYKDNSGKQFIKLTDLKTYNTSNQEVAANALQCGVVYYVDIPTSVFDIAGVDGQNVNTFMLAAKTVLQKTGSITGKVTTVTTSTTYNTVDFVHVELFPLD